MRSPLPRELARQTHSIIEYYWKLLEDEGAPQGQRQTLLFSATVPKKIQNFAKSALVKPITINVGRAGAASLDVIQEVDYVKEEAKMVYLLECLQKTPPPVRSFLLFLKNKI